MVGNSGNLIVTGGSGFIGSNLVRWLLKNTEYLVHNLDALTYAGNNDSLSDCVENDRYNFWNVDITNAPDIERVFDEVRPDKIMHLAAESHVDRSIDNPAAFIKTNVMGTYVLLENARRHFDSLTGDEKSGFRFLHVSTDEVYGSLGPTGLFNESTPYSPHSPYSASKAASDHLARAWHDTYNLPVLVTNCSNNYGPYQFPEKLIPVTIINAIAGNRIPVYGQGENVRDWLHVLDHCDAMYRVLSSGTVGHTYNIGGNNELRNIDLVRLICEILDVERPRGDGLVYSSQIEFVVDRPGHDLRYAIDASKISSELDWEPAYSCREGIQQTIEWYLSNEDWWKSILDGKYRLERQGVKQIFTGKL